MSHDLVVALMDIARDVNKRHMIASGFDGTGVPMEVSEVAISEGPTLKIRERKPSTVTWYIQLKPDRQGGVAYLRWAESSDEGAVDNPTTYRFADNVGAVTAIREQIRLLQKNGKLD